MKILTVMFALMLSGCGPSFREYYGVDNMWQLLTESSCVREHGMTCKERKELEASIADSKARIKSNDQGATVVVPVAEKEIPKSK